LEFNPLVKGDLIMRFSPVFFPFLQQSIVPARFRSLRMALLPFRPGSLFINRAEPVSRAEPTHATRKVCHADERK
jgi:hypothetical protein